MKTSIALTLLAVLTLSACKAPAPPVTDDTLVTSNVDGVALTHRHAVHAPQSFTPVNETYRALYNASVMTSPDFGGKVVRYLENGKPFMVLGEVENHWLAIAEAEAEPSADQQPDAQKSPQLIGYVPFKAGVKSDLYDATLRSDRPRPRKTKKVCVDVGGQSKACRNNDTATWILE
ncbi:SH3 domain-containing protein [Erwinia sp. BNK-24-b]|uniref:SH3 domain-containing protein n=1 Tax=Erwinia TaxID=551 RepID=UPI001FEF75CB|nr:SH3 domain-containing protein [Erwinia phyllosphaerae]